jgi:hypothetical protein
MEKIDKIAHTFFFNTETNLPDLENYGIYRLGLTGCEIYDYLQVRCHQSKIPFKGIVNKFYRIAGCNTCAVIDGKTLMYRHDVLRFAEKLFNGTNTYFD